MQQKLEFYQEYGVEEYYIYDPETYVLEGLMRRGNQLVPLEQVNGWVSPRLGIKFETAGGELGIYHPNGKKFLTPLELNAESEQRIQAERQRADLERQRADLERQQKEAERQQKEAERQRADLERQRAERFAEYLRSLGLDPDHLPEGN